MGCGGGESYRKLNRMNKGIEKRGNTNLKIIVIIKKRKKIMTHGNIQFRVVRRRKTAIMTNYSVFIPK